LEHSYDRTGIINYWRKYEPFNKYVLFLCRKKLVSLPYATPKNKLQMAYRPKCSRECFYGIDKEGFIYKTLNSEIIKENVKI
jgi:hypothetical protein